MTKAKAKKGRKRAVSLTGKAVQAAQDEAEIVAAVAKAEQAAKVAKASLGKDATDVLKSVHASSYPILIRLLTGMLIIYLCV